MSGSGRLADTLVRTLAAKAAQETVEQVPPFDPTRRPMESPDIRPAAGRRMVPAAAVLLVVALVGGVVTWVTRGGEESDDTRTVADDPNGWLRPRWVPEGMEVWDIDWSTVSTADDPAGDSWSNDQLFGDPDVGRALYLEYGPRVSAEARSGESVVVRGVEGTVVSAADDPAGTSGIAWTENGIAITARFKGMAAAEAAGALSGLSWRTARAADGFAPPGDGSLPLRGERLSAQRRSTRTLGLIYGIDVPGTGVRSLSIMTSAGGGMAPGYLDRWFDDGGAEPARADGSRRSFDAENSLMHAYWPDGREVWISFRQVDRETLERVVDSMALDPEPDLTLLRDRFPANVTELPVLAATDTAVGRLELHGVGHFSRLCLRKPGAATVDCGVHANATLARPDDTVLTVPGSWLIDGRWYVGVASQDGESEIYGDRAVDVRDDVLPAAATSVGGWRLLFVEPPPEIREVTTTMHDLDGLTTITRPT